MEHYNRKSVTDSLKKYDCLAKDSDFIEVTEWYNGEGWDISINDNKLISKNIINQNLTTFIDLENVKSFALNEKNLYTLVENKIYSYTILNTNN